ncbi:chromosomal replication initiator protein DnaA [Methylobacillus rhizosphaerae]|uniref:Chromosomal replication initiator protein DnaA n=1 Tax=Methylobacillus rhizosphaerae TaxID=551994 RepID=A0A238ZDN4_9PROT|nr:chromosomal replication initiator protein DnaA [Methylobacillus rhizosphaerae]SNR81209.1 chromosomal replication initiator protein DnaA [Methylobacillus rhizosphaerae]
MENFWSLCLGRFEEELSTQQFNTWFKPLQFEAREEILRVLAPNRFVQNWVKDRYLRKIETLAEEFFSEPRQIELALYDASDKQAVSRPVSANKKPVETVEQITAKTIESEVNKVTKPVIQKSAASAARKPKPAGEGSGLNPELRFDNYVTGKANQLACAAAIQIADNPGTAYNPLFIYGGVGLGKTHILQAIGNHLKVHRPDAKIRYLHAERYVSDVVKAYEHKAFDEFKRQYHSLDLLLIDDIQFLAKKGRTQEEFFYAFNSLIEAKKQIIITCDTYPKEIADMDERLRTRFSWGLTVEVQPPELEMRVAILHKKAEVARVSLDEDVAFFIAKQVRSSVRELEGALNRIIAMANFTGHIIDVSLAKEALKDLIAVRGRQITIDNIQKTVADYYKIKVAEMYSKKRSRNFARPRQIAMALARELTNHSFPEIGEAFGGRHHTTVMHACDEIEQLRQNDPNVARDISILIQVIRD